MAWPTGAISEANIDAGADNPTTARNQLLEAIQKLNILIAHTEALKLTGGTLTGNATFGPYANPRIVMKNVAGQASEFHAGADAGSVFSGGFNLTDMYHLYAGGGLRINIAATGHVTTNLPANGTAPAFTAHGSAGGFGSALMAQGATNAALAWHNSGQAADNRYWDSGSFGSATWALRAVNDANGAAALAVSAERSGATITRVNVHTDLRFKATAPKIEHETGGQRVSELLYDVSSSRGRVRWQGYSSAGTQGSVGFEVSGQLARFGRFTYNDGLIQVVGGIEAAVNGNTTISAGGGSTEIVADATTRPSTDNSFTCGVSGGRWSAVWAANGTIQTSDARDKVLLQRIDPAKAHRFIQLLEPWFIRWVVGGNKVERVEDGVEEFDEEVFEDVAEPSERVEVIDGAPRLVRSATIRKQVFDQVQVVDVDGKPATVEIQEDTGLLDARSEPLKRKRRQPLLHAVPRLRKAVRPKFTTVVTPMPGVRVHASLVAQQVRQALEQADLLVGGEACGLWVLDDPTKPDSSQSLRYDQFIPFIVAAMQYAPPPAPVAEVTP